ncbi:MAG: type 1 glutamine amidotransferase [Halalkalicoccus sp.]|nr:type 1 glutamine amidotransferase [Halalkalicoccus sp.]
MDSLRVALLNASDKDEATRENFGRDVDADVRSFAANEGELPDGYAYDAVIVSGSRASVYWNEPWIESLIDWVTGALDDGVPVLGVCFGHQLVVHALGGEVRDMGECEIGYREIERVGDSDLLAGLLDRFVAFETHSDEIATVPDGATVIAENEYAVQAFRADRAFGVQFHPEYDRDMADRVTRSKDLSDERIGCVLDGITDENVAAAADAKSLFDNFLAYAASLPSRLRETEPAE